MFNKDEYWKNRKNGDRGQESVKDRFYPKGEPYLIEDKQGIRININKEGSHRSFTPGGKMMVFNRSESRTRVVDRSYSKKGFRGHINNYVRPDPLYPPTLTNHDRVKGKTISL